MNSKSSKTQEKNTKARIRAIINSTPLPKEKQPVFTPEQIEKLKTAGGIALAVLMVAGILTLSAVAPNIFSAIGKIFQKPRGRRYSPKELQQKVTRTFYYLKSSGLIRMKPTKDDVKIFLTALAKRKIKHMQFETMQVETPKKWDEKWWQVAADIPTEEYRFAADALRIKLKSMHFYPLQRTLWFYPHDPRLEVDWIIRTYGIERFVTIMEIVRLDRNDEEQMEKFFRKLKIL